MAGIRFEALAPEYALLVLLLPVVFYHALKTEAAAGRARKMAVAVLRALGIILIATALVRVRAWRLADETRLCTLAVVDVSESIPRDKMSDVAKQIAELSKSASEERQFGMLIFAGRCRLSIPPAAKAITEQAAQSIIASAFDAKPGTQAFADLERNETRIDAALELAASTFPAACGKRMVLWSDGNETDGSGLSLAGNLRNSGVDINARTVPATGAQNAGGRPLKVLVAGLNVPTQVRIQEAFDAKVALMSTRETAGKILLYRNGFLAGSKDVTLSQGATEVTFRQSITESGQYVYRAVFETKEIQGRENDEAFAYLTAVGAPHILVIGTHELESSRLIEALRSQKSFIEYRDAYGAPQTLLELFGFDAVVLNNVPAASLSENQMRVLRDYVRDFGGGAVVIGGQHSLTAGRYAGTPLEDILPVSCFQEGLTRPSSSVVLVVDTSRSMLTQKLPNGRDFDAPQFVRTVAQAISDRLAPNDFLGIIGTGNERTAPRWLVRMQKVYDRDHIRDDIQREFAGPAAFDKSSNVYQSMRIAAEELSQQDTRLKQIVVLSDGYFDSGYSYPRLAAKLNSDHYRISTIAGGPDSDTKVLAEMARWGGGQCLESDSSAALLEAIKGLFGEAETGVVVEDPFRPRKIAESPLIENVDINTAPVLFGYVRTKLKIGAANILAVPPEYDPLLASWDCGEGRVAAFASDVRDKWGVLWVREWGRNFDTFWDGVVMGVARGSQTTRLVPHLSVSGQSVSASVDLLDLKDRFISGKKVRCEFYSLGEQGLFYTRSNIDRFELNADGPGRYSATHRIRSKGLYAVKFRGPEHGQIVSTGVVVSNFREYLSLAPDAKFLRELCEAGGGKLDAETAALTSLAGKRRQTVTDVGHWALLTGCLLFLADVIARRWPAIWRALQRSPS